MGIGSTVECYFTTLALSFSLLAHPCQIITENDSSFVSAKLEQFLPSNGIKLITSVPYHPATSHGSQRRTN
jgi:hypothetical protein